MTSLPTTPAIQAAVETGNASAVATALLQTYNMSDARVKAHVQRKGFESSGFPEHAAFWARVEAALAPAFDMNARGGPDVCYVQDGTTRVVSVNGNCGEYRFNVESFREANGAAETGVTLYRAGRRVPTMAKTDVRQAVLAAFGKLMVGELARLTNRLGEANPDHTQLAWHAQNALEHAWALEGDAYDLDATVYACVSLAKTVRLQERLAREIISEQLPLRIVATWNGTVVLDGRASAVVAFDTARGFFEQFTGRDAAAWVSETFYRKRLLETLMRDGGLPAPLPLRYADDTGAAVFTFSKV